MRVASLVPAATEILGFPLLRLAGPLPEEAARV